MWTRYRAAAAAGVFAAAAAFGGAAQAVTVTSLPYDGTPDWREVIFGGTSMTLTPGVSTTLTTAESRGVWFGSLGGEGPVISNAVTGNALTLEASFSSNAADWSAYLYDGTYAAALRFRPTPCVDNCYGQTPADGVELTFDDGSGGVASTVFVGLDMTKRNTFGFLLRDGLVAYRVNNATYAGQALFAPNSRLLVIGDGSGSTRTGVGAMTVYGVTYDSAPEGRVTLPQPGVVPEPGTWALMIAGFGLAGGALRRRRAAVQG